MCAHFFHLLCCEQRNLVSAKFFLFVSVSSCHSTTEFPDIWNTSRPQASVQASSAAAKALSSQTKRHRRMTSSAPVSTTASPVEAPDHSTLVSPQFLETLVNRVADEVSRRMATSQLPAPSPVIDEVPAGPPSTTDTAPQNPQVALASTIVQDSLGSVSSELTGLPPQVLPCVQPQVPGQLFNSVALPVDARVSDTRYVPRFGIMSMWTLAHSTPIRLLNSNTTLKSKVPKVVHPLPSALNLYLSRRKSRP